MNRQKIEEVRDSAFDAMCTLHDCYLAGSLTELEVFNRLEVWHKLHTGACRQLRFCAPEQGHTKARTLVASALFVLQREAWMSPMDGVRLEPIMTMLRNAMVEMGG